MPYANNKSADQPAHLRSLNNDFVVHCLDTFSCDVAHMMLGLILECTLMDKGTDGRTDGKFETC